MSEIKQKRLQILLKLFGEQIKQNIETENLNISEKEVLNKFSDYEITESGRYLEWMVKCYIFNGFLYEDLYKVKETLEIFHENKMKLSKDKRDIQQYKTLSELWVEVKKFVEQKDDFLSTNEQKRKEKELAYAETEFLYEDDNLRVVAPLTKEASQWWGKGTRWCTAADKNNRFHNYFKFFPLIIFDFKDDKKWQLWMYEENIQFMDEDDNKLSDKKIKEKWKDIENIFGKLLRIDGLLLKIIPEELKTKELCEIAVQQNGFALYNISEELITKEICGMAVNNNGKVLNFVPEELKIEEICEMAVNNNGLALQYVPKELKTKKLCEIAVKNYGLALQYIPDKLITKELCEIAVNNNGKALYYVPNELKTKELYESAVQNNGNALLLIPKELRTIELYEMAVKNYGEVLQFVPIDLMTEKLCEVAVRNNGNVLWFVPKKFRTKEICEIAVNNNGNAINFVPYELKTPELCEIAVRQNNEALCYIPDNLKTKKLYEIVEKNNITNNSLIQYKEIFSILRQENNLNLGN